MTFNATQFKANFPLFQHPSNQDLIYLDNAATTQKPLSVIQAIQNFYMAHNANAHRASHRLGRLATTMQELTREKAKAFLGARSSNEIWFTSGATEGLNLIAQSIGTTLRAGDEIILSELEHHANLVPWHMLAERLNLQLKFIGFEAGKLQLTELSSLITPRTKVLAITAASNTLGCVSDLKQLFTHLRDIRTANNFYTVIDAAQLTAHEQVNVAALDCDFLVCSAHKFYGPTGLGLCYGKEALLNQLPPAKGGGEMIANVDLAKSSYTQAPHRLEAGTAPLAAIAGLSACLDFWETLDREALRHYEGQLCYYLHEQLSSCSFIEVFSKPEANLGVAAFAPHHSHSLASADICHWLDEHNIATRAGQHCTQPLLKKLGIASLVRASLSAYNTFEDIDRFIAILKKIDLPQQPLKTEVSDTTENKDFVADDVSEFNYQQLQKGQPWQQRYQTIMEWAQHISDKPSIRQTKYLVTGCETQTWLRHRVRQAVTTSAPAELSSQQQHEFSVDSDSRVIKGLAAVLLTQIQQKTTAEILALDIAALFKELGLAKHLSQSRSNGFRALIEQARSLVTNDPT